MPPRLARPSFPKFVSPSDTVRLAEVLSALTYALDLTEGQRPGHTLRTALIAMRLGNEIGLDSESMAALYYAALLKDAGCSSNAARMASLFGSDDQSVKRDMRLVDWHDRWRMAMRTAKNCGIGRNPIARIQHFLRIAQTPDMTRDIISARCERGAQIAVALGFPGRTSEAIAHVDEHWCGMGYPVGLAGTEIPMLSRIILLAQTVEVYWMESGTRSAMEMAGARSGKWFDPTLVKQVIGWRRDTSWWARLADRVHLDSDVVALEPGSQPMLATPERLDATAHAFAAVIDAKTPFTFHHSTNVARYATAIAATTGADHAVQQDVMRAGLLHDIGKLGISNRILDKPGTLTITERNEIKMHPVWSWHILGRVTAFRHIAASASQHHERLDGRGYPWALTASELDDTARILAIADVYEALTANRPYRIGMSISAVKDIMVRDRGTAFDGNLLDAAIELADQGVFATLASSGDNAIERLERIPIAIAQPARRHVA